MNSFKRHTYEQSPQDHNTVVVKASPINFTNYKCKTIRNTQRYVTTQTKLFLDIMTCYYIAHLQQWNQCTGSQHHFIGISIYFLIIHQQNSCEHLYIKLIYNNISHKICTSVGLKACAQIFLLSLCPKKYSWRSTLFIEEEASAGNPGFSCECIKYFVVPYI